MQHSLHLYRCSPDSDVHVQAKVIVFHSGSPRVFSPAVSEWWDTEIGADNSYRVVNNADVVPSLPPQVITGNYG